MKATAKHSYSQLPLPIEDMTIEIPLTQGYVAIVDAVDGDLAQFRWYAYRNGSNVYAGRSVAERNLPMHRVILGRVLGRELGQHEQVDHVHGIGCDNRRSQIRLATHAQNVMNKRRYKNNSSGYKGVSFENDRWRGYISKSGAARFLGYFTTAEDAAIAYNHAALELFGEFARFNDIPDWRTITPTKRPLPPCVNESGVRSILRQGQRWRARLWHQGKFIKVGTFDTVEEAFAAQTSLKRELGIE